MKTIEQLITLPVTSSFANFPHQQPIHSYLTFEIFHHYPSESYEFMRYILCWYYIDSFLRYTTIGRFEINEKVGAILLRHVPRFPPFASGKKSYPLLTYFLWSHTDNPVLHTVFCSIYGAILWYNKTFKITYCMPSNVIPL